MARAVDCQAFGDRYGAPSFSRLSYFPGGRRTVGFGLDATFGSLRLHLAVDRAGGRLAFVPFDTERAELFAGARYAGSFGTLLILHAAEADFEVRIGHLNPTRFSPLFRALLDSRRPIPAGTVIGPAGSLGKSIGAHLHTEIVSRLQRSVLCEEFAGAPPPIGEEEVARWAAGVGLDEAEAVKRFHAELQWRSVEELTTGWARRLDYHSGWLRTFYSSWDLFAGM